MLDGMINHLKRQREYDALVDYFGRPDALASPGAMALHERIMRILNGEEADPRMPKRAIDKDCATLACKMLLEALGEDVTREGLRDTPRRMAGMLLDLCAPKEFEFTTFDSEGMDQMVVQSNIPFHSLCEHHVLPFMGTAAVAYIPKGKIVGLSKLTRAVHYCARGLQNQERVTRAIATILEEELDPLGVGVVIRARHLCMELRGVQAPNVWTTTSDVRGLFREDASARAEFLSLVK